MAVETSARPLIRPPAGATFSREGRRGVIAASAYVGCFVVRR
jgi:hypothetical protein